VGTPLQTFTFFWAKPNPMKNLAAILLVLLAVNAFAHRKDKSKEEGVSATGDYVGTFSDINGVKVSFN
jgi:hypothetical protein